MVYCRRVGRGRLVYCSLGHDRRSLAHPSYLRLVANAVDWLLEAE